MPTAIEIADSMFSRAKDYRAMLTSKQRRFLEDLIYREIEKVEREQKRVNPHRQACACVGDRAWIKQNILCLRTDTGEYRLGRLPNGAGCLWHEKEYTT